MTSSTRYKVCIAGATGWVGRALCPSVAQAEDMALVGAVSPSRRGQNLGQVLGYPAIDLSLSGSVVEALAVPTDVMVDFTHPDAAKANVLAAVARRVHAVIGTSGLTEADFDEIHAAALRAGVGVIAAGNFAITAVLLQRFAREAARYLSQWEIVDYASAGKVDAPSGTARELAARLAQVRTPQVQLAIAETIGPRESRGATLSGSQVHSVRLPSYVIAIEVIFGGDDERLSLRHDAGRSATPYLQGTLLAIRKVGQRVGLVRGLENVLD